jgi:hypothetical protein
MKMTRCAMGRSLMVGLMASLVGAGAARAEEQRPAASGPRVRVTAAGISGKRLVGTLTAIDQTNLTLRREDGRPVEVPRAAITRIELSRGASRKGKGAGIGALVGIGAAVAFGLAVGESDESFVPDKGTAMLASAIVAVPLGTLLGWAAAPGERWVATSPDRFRMSVAPVRGGGVGASLSFRF